MYVFVLDTVFSLIFVNRFGYQSLLDNVAKKIKIIQEHIIF